MAEPNQPSELAPPQSRVRRPSQGQTPADDLASPALAEVGEHPASPEDEPPAPVQAAIGDSIPAPEGKFLISPEQAQAQAKETADRMRVYRGLSRELNETEWKNPGTRKLILEQLAQLEYESNELKIYRSKYHEKDKESAVLRQQLIAPVNYLRQAL